MEAKYQIEIASGITTYRMAHNHAELKKIAETVSGRITVTRSKRIVFSGNPWDLLSAIKVAEMDGRRL